MTNETTNPTENPQPTTTCDDDSLPLKELLPELDETPHDKLIDYFKRLALRCFNSENKLDLAMEINHQDQGTIREMRSVNSTLMLEVERLNGVIKLKNEMIQKLEIDKRSMWISRDKQA